MCRSPIPGLNCTSRNPPKELHRHVKEVLEILQFTCPGCKESYKYEQFFEHASECNEIKEEHKIQQPEVAVQQSSVSQSQVAFRAQSNTPNVIYVTDKDSKTLFVLGRDYSINKFKVNY
jgi:hypothetical protein